MRYILIILFSVFSVSAWSQGPPITTTKATITRQLVLPQDTLVILTADSGSLAFKGDTLYKAKPRIGFTTCRWVKVGYVGISNGIQNITGLVTAGTNVTVTGSGTTASPYVINASGGGGGGSVDTVRIINDSVSTNSNVIAKAIPFNSLRNKKISLQGVTSMSMYGDSYTVGVGANTGKGYADILPLMIGLPSTNYGVSGSGIYYSSAQANQTVNPASNTKFITLMTDLNDLRRSGDNLATYKKIRGGINSFISNNVVDSVFYMNNGRISQFGSWTTFNASAFGGKAGGTYGGLGLTTQTANDSLTFTCYGTSVIIQWLNSVIPGGSGGNFGLYVDNVLDTTVICDESDGISDGPNNNQTISGALLLNDMGVGPHKIKIVNNGANHLYLDYLAIPKSPNRVAPMLVALTPKMNAAGYLAYGGSDIAFNKGDSTILKTVAAWSQFPVTVVYPMDFYNISYLSGDNIHPNTAGHALIANAFLDKLNPFLSASSATPYTASQGLSQVGFDFQFGGPISSNRTLYNAINGNKYIEVGPTANYGDANVNSFSNANAKLSFEGSNGSKGKVTLSDYQGAQFYSDGNQWVSGSLPLAANNAIFSRQAKFEGFDGTADISINGAGNSKDIYVTLTGVAIKGAGLVPNYAMHVFGSAFVTDSFRIGKTPPVGSPDSVYVKTPGSTVVGAYAISALGGTTNLTYTQNALNNLVNSSTGTDATLLPATSSLAGLLDTARAKFIDSARGRLIVDSTPFPLTATYIAYGNASNQLTGKSAFSFDGTNNLFTNAGKSKLLDTLFVGKTIVDSANLRIVGDIISYQSGSITTSTGFSYTTGGINAIGRNATSGRYEEIPNSVITSSASTLTLGYGGDYFFNGTTATYTLPAISAQFVGRKFSIIVKNIGSSAVTINSASGSTIYDTAPVATYNLAAGASVTFISNGTYLTVN